MMKLFVVNGPNLNMLGIREKNIYGAQTYEQLVAYIREVCARENVEVECFQSNHEGAIVDYLQSAYGRADGIVINPAAYTHTSVAILDALKAIALPAAEVHLSDVSKREAFRQVSYAGLACQKSFIGMGFRGYEEAILYLKSVIGLEA
jgi:3-dehydroquinate dehydratase II